MVTAGDLRPVNASNEMFKFADDTYLIVPANNIETRAQELNHVEEWATCNNLSLNRSKTVEIISSDTRRPQKYQEPTLLADIERVTNIKVLGVSLTDKLSMKLHINNVLSSCSQTLYAMKILRVNGMNNTDLQSIFKATILAKVYYAASAWWGFTTDTDRHRVDAFIKRSIQHGICPTDTVEFAEQCSTFDRNLLQSAINNSNHVLHALLPPESQAHQHYDLRSRTHNRQLPLNITHLVSCNFLNRALYADSY